MQVEAPAALLLPPMEEKPALAALLGGLGGDERGVEQEELARVELVGAVELGTVQVSVGGHPGSDFFPSLKYVMFEENTLGSPIGLKDTTCRSVPTNERVAAAESSSSAAREKNVFIFRQNQL